MLINHFDGLNFGGGYGNKYIKRMRVDRHARRSNEALRIRNVEANQEEEFRLAQWRDNKRLGYKIINELKGKEVLVTKIRDKVIYKDGSVAYRFPVRPENIILLKDVE